MHPIHKNTADVAGFVAGDGTFLRELLHPANDAVELPYSLAHAQIRPGEASLNHRLTGRDELYYFLSGTGELHVDDRVLPIAAGDLVLVPANAAQYLVNTGADVLQFLCIVCPPWQAAVEEIV